VRRIAGAIGLFLLVAAIIIGTIIRHRPGELRPRPNNRPELLLLTSLPIIFPDQFTLNAAKSPALKALQSRYRVVPISVADRASLTGHRLLLMAQPRAQPAEVLVDLDMWVRGGGRVLLLADPALQWPSERPLGDALRPPLAFADTGLLLHWGVRLDAPDELGPKTMSADGKRIETAAPGTLVATAPNCAVMPPGLVADCTVGKGKSIVIADADFLDSNRPENLGFLLRELERLER
jgi:hypothetical protein